ncbi:MAG: flagellar filament capping protein FliD [Proteobacteria bacterium]|nr:flagellar filament capping protein FliD [Pseudomonadota bacterium]
MASITASGLGSTLDVNGIVSQLMAIEQQPITKLDTKEADYQAKLSAYGTLKSGMAALQDATRSLTSTASFKTLKATPSDSSLLSASASSTAVAGTYSIDISQLAQSQKLAAAGQTSPTTVIGSGTLTFDFGTITDTLPPSFNSTAGKYGAGTGFASNNTPRTVTIDNNHTSLSGIRDAINAANIGVSAVIVNDGSSTPNRLVLTSDNSGVANSLKISVTDEVAGSTALSDLLAHDPANDVGQNLSEKITAQNANITVNGIAASKSSNTVTDMIHGVTLNLLKKTTATASVTVASDTSGIKSALDAFVKAYNDVAKPLHDLSAYDPSTKTAAVLQGDSAVRSIQSQMRNVIADTPAGITGSFKSLSQIGVAFQKDGSLSIDATKLQNAIDSNAGDVATIVATTGGKLKTLLDSQLSAGGPLATKTNGVNLSIKLLNDQRTKLKDKLVITEQHYRTQYAALDSLLGSMKATSDSLTQQLAGLPTSSSKTG